MAVEYHCRCRAVSRSEAERRAHTDEHGHNEHVIATVVRPGVSAEWRERHGCRLVVLDGGKAAWAVSFIRRAGLTDGGKAA